MRSGTNLCCILNTAYRCINCGWHCCFECSDKERGMNHLNTTRCYTIKLRKLPGWTAAQNAQWDSEFAIGE